MIPGSDIATLAERFERFGALTQARQLFRQAVEGRGDDAGLWARLGRVCRALGQHDEAVASFRHAVELCSDCADLHHDLGISLVGQGQIDQAIESYRAALLLRADYPEANNNLGNALVTRGEWESAVACYRQALATRPNYPTASYNLGNALVALGEHDEGVTCYRRAVQLRPDFVQAWVSLGGVLRRIGKTDEAVACYGRAAELRPDDPDMLCELGIILAQRGELGCAVARYEQALQLRPDFATAYNNLGLALLGQGRLEEARLSFEQALYLVPDMAEAHNNLGLALLNQGRAQEARQSFEGALALRPEMADASNNLGLALDALGEPDDALAWFVRAVEIDSRHVGALTNLGNAYKDQGHTAQAVAAYRKVLSLDPDNAPVHSNLLLAMQYEDGADPHVILAEARSYGRRRAGSVGDDPEYVRSGDPAGRRLRIGYVSPDFREHPVVYFLEPILAAHDHERFEICCYADVPRPDDATRRLMDHADLWRSFIGLSDAEAADLIRQDRVDVLVDLAGHTGGNRLPMFARRPAPVQVSYLGYLGSTGLTAMDYYLTDAHVDPPGLAEGHYQEQLIRLPECGFCYCPGPAPEVSIELPATRNGMISFGCLNNLAKVSDEALGVWSRILAAVPGSGLLLRTGAGRSAESRMRGAFRRNCISPDRLGFVGRVATRSDYLKLYHTLDIALDPFPYNGVTTTCDALWMGVPAITLAGRMCVSRQGVRFLRSAGLDELLAETPEDYVRIAADLADDVPRLAAMHSGLRDRMRRSQLMNAHRLTRDLEAAYHTIWERRFITP